MLLEFLGQLNRIAGTNNYGAAAAANTYAQSVNPDTPDNLEVVASLNWAAFSEGTDPHLEDWMELQGVCNQLAGEIGLGVNEALSRI